MACTICNKKLELKYKIMSEELKLPSEEDMERIYWILPFNDNFHVTKNSDIIEIKVHYHESNLTQFFEDLKFEEAIW